MPKLQRALLMLPLLSVAVPGQEPGPAKKLTDLGHGAFATTFGGTDGDVANAVAQGAGAEVFVAGWTRSFGAGDADLWVARIGRRGRAHWERALGGSARDDAAAVLATSDGGCLAVGSTSSFGAGGADGWAVKLAADGTVQWQRAYGGALDDEFRTVAASPDGYYVGGWTTGATTALDAWVLELDPQGGILWQQKLVGTLDDRVLSLDATAGGVVLAAGSNSDLGRVPSVPFVRPWVIELSGTGSVLWQKAYNLSGGDVWNHIVALEGGGFLVSGEILAFAFFRGDLWVARLDASGDVLWSRAYGDNFGVNWVDSGAAALPSAGGGFAAVGSTGTAGAGSEDLWFLGLDAAGTLQRGSTYGGPGFDGATGMARAPGGGFTIVGRAQPVDGGPPDALVLRVSPAGRTARSCRLQGDIDPGTWSAALQVDPVTLAPTPTTFTPTGTNASVLALNSGVLTCPPVGDPPFVER